MSKSESDYSRESAGREQIGELQLKGLRALLAVVTHSNQFYRTKLSAVGLRTADNIRSLDDLRLMPFTTKQELVADQETNPLFGTNLSFPLEQYVKYHQTSGTSGRPLRWLDTDESWAWWLRCWSAVYRAAGVGTGDRVFFAFGFGPFIGFWSAFEAARLTGAMSIPGGGLSSEQRLRMLIDTRATVLVCTPTYALHLVEVAQRSGIDLSRSAVRVALHAGEPGASIPSTRQRIEEAWGAQCFDHTGATEVGATGFSCTARDGVHLNEGEFIFEVVNPHTLQASSEGELVVTNLGRHGMPVVRYRLGDVVKLEQATCECGRTFARILGGVLGRVDDMVTIRGVNVFPSAIESIVRQFPAIVEFQSEVTRSGELDDLHIKIEPQAGAGPNVAEIIANKVHQQLGLRPQVTLADAGSLPRFELKARRFVDRRSRLPA
jgi:phenylacetate-CoA ligase